MLSEKKIVRNEQPVCLFVWSYRLLFFSRSCERDRCRFDERSCEDFRRLCFLLDGLRDRPMRECVETKSKSMINFRIKFCSRSRVKSQVKKYSTKHFRIFKSIKLTKRFIQASFSAPFGHC